MSDAPLRSEPSLESTTFSLSAATEKTLQNSTRRVKRKSPGKGRALNRRRARKEAAQTATSPNGGALTDNYPLIVHCHLCWDWVWQRPQQFISRLSHRHRALFVEMLSPDPALAAPLARVRSPKEFPNLTLLSLQFPASRWGDGAYVDGERRRLVQEFLAGPGAGQFEDPVQWFYDPMAVTAFAGQLGERLTVYDCMDELSKFRGAPPDLVERECQLLGRADVVFTGGRRLFQAKSQLHHNCHFHGCGVDAYHFGKARAAETAIPQDLAALGERILGYFGVIDERMDYQLVAALAESHPQWSVVMLGPTAKVDDKKLPRRPNLHWLGPRPYAELPSYCRGFDVCLMPFALNEATAFINPTKALEYMATGRPIVSTAVPDVVHNFGSVVKVANSVEDFVAQCHRALEQPDYGAIARGLKMASENSWDSIVEQLEEHIEEALRTTQSSSKAPRPDPKVQDVPFLNAALGWPTTEVAA
jgi:glycosyltransferase involved in cell wall biosynthesis